MILPGPMMAPPSISAPSRVRVPETTCRVEPLLRKKMRLEVTEPANWSVPVGSVDLIGETPTGTQFDFYPGHGGYVDLDGTSDAAGALQTLGSFAAGSYTLSFDLGGNARGDVDKTTTITIGDWSTSLTLPSTSPYQLYTFNVTTNGGHLSFADGAGGNQDIGNILDNVTLYWLTNTAVSSARLYWESKLAFFAPKHVAIPVAVSVFPDELYAAPRSWAEKAYPKLIHYNKLDKGGHFAAWEQPELLVDELRTAFRSLG